MCLIVLAWRAHPKFPLIVAANRDEFHARKAAPAAFWRDQPQILGGREMRYSERSFGPDGADGETRHFQFSA